MKKPTGNPLITTQFRNGYLDTPFDFRVINLRRPYQGSFAHHHDHHLQVLWVIEVKVPEPNTI
tara:strand:- start:309 stop:497 length:189 start_codon:yes stop_codon:yes gene_type:complete